MTVLGDPNDPFDTSRSDVRNVIYGTGLNPGGSTSIGDGIETGRGTLTGSTAQTKSLVVITDGIETAPKWISQVASQITENTYAVGIGKAADVSAVALETVSGPGGHPLITGSALDDDNQFLLKKFFLQILAGVSNADVVLDPVGFIAPGQIQRVPFTICDADNLVDVILTAEQQQGMAFLLETPSGQLIDPSLVTTWGGTFVQTDQVAYYRVPLPLLVEPGRPSQTGTWHAVLGMRGRHGSTDFTHLEVAGDVGGQGRGLRYSVNVHAWSDVSLAASSHQDRFTLGAEVIVIGTLTDSGIPVTANSSIWAEVTYPSGSTSTLVLSPDGDNFTGSFVANRPGDYRIRVRARGTTGRGNTFPRERTLTASVWRGGDVAPPWGSGDPGGTGGVDDTINDHDKRWCEFVRCVLLTLSKNERFAETLKRSGLDLRDFLKCAELLCPDATSRPVPGRGSSTELAVPPEASPTC